MIQIENLWNFDLSDSDAPESDHDQNKKTDKGQNIQINLFFINYNFINLILNYIYNHMIRTLWSFNLEIQNYSISL